MFRPVFHHFHDLLCPLISQHNVRSVIVSLQSSVTTETRLESVYNTHGTSQAE